MNSKWKFVFSVVFFVVSCTSQSTTETPNDPALQVDSHGGQEFTESISLNSELPRLLITYQPSDEEILNPERGFAGDADFKDLEFSDYYEEGYTLVYSYIRLDQYRERDLPADLLDDIDAYFALLRKSGVKAILRFSYNDGPYPNPEPDASLTQILRHIHQIKPILYRNVDVIAWVEAGFVGAWGEWHTSTNLLDKDPSAKKEILFTLLDALPLDRMILLRYPMDIMTIFPTPLTEEAAFSETYQARVGFHNDCFLSSDDDENTYGRRGVFTVDQEMDYLSEMTRYTPVGGESCSFNPPRSDCDTAMTEATLLHITELNDGWYPEVLDAWEQQGCYKVFQQRLGYRFLLLSATITGSVPPGGVLNLDVKLKNDGFASMVNPRKIYIVLDGPAHYQVNLPDDPRYWSPGEESNFTARLRIPAMAPEGKYRVAVWMPDYYKSLWEDPRYSVQFANEEVWDDRIGFNVLATINVDSSLIGDIDPLAPDLIILP